VIRVAYADRPVDPASEAQKRKIVSLCSVLQDVPDYAWQRVWWSMRLASKAIDELLERR
jgi:hypothetical protein